MNQMTHVSLSSTGVSVTVVGETKSERQLSVARQASAGAVMFLCSRKGKVGQVARVNTAKAGLVEIANQCAWPTNSYTAFAESVSATLGENVTISNRASFMSFPDRLQDRIAMVKAGKVSKSGNPAGFVTDKKTGELKPGAKLAELMELHAFATNVIRASDEISQTNKAKAEEEKAAKALANS